jgi:hypothetical protein
MSEFCYLSMDSGSQAQILGNRVITTVNCLDDLMLESALSLVIISLLKGVLGAGQKNSKRSKLSLNSARSISKSTITSCRVLC